MLATCKIDVRNACFSAISIFLHVTQINNGYVGVLCFRQGTDNGEVLIALITFSRLKKVTGVELHTLSRITNFTCGF